MRGSRLRWPLAGAAIAALGVTAAALGGSGIGGVFNLGQANTVDATSFLRGTAANAVLDVTNNGAGASSYGVVGRTASPTAPALAGTNSGGGPGLKGTSTTGSGLYGQSTSGLGLRAVTAGSQPALKATNTGTGPGGAFEAGGGAAPFTVNSQTRVTNLNADLLDGLDSTEVGSGYSQSAVPQLLTLTPPPTAGASNPPIATATLRLSRPSWVVATATGYGYGYDADLTHYPCLWRFQLSFDGVVQDNRAAWARGTAPSAFDQASIYDSLTGLSVQDGVSLAAGTHTIDLVPTVEPQPQECSMGIGRARVTALAVPFSVDAAPPAAATGEAPTLPKP
jgi:hypothetical protein